MHDGQATGLGERHDQRLLPVGGEPRVHVGLQHQRVQLTARVAEPDAVVADVEDPADLPEDVEERHHLLLAGASTVMSPLVASAALAQLAARSGRASHGG